MGRSNPGTNEGRQIGAAHGPGQAHMKGDKRETSGDKEPRNRPEHPARSEFGVLNSEFLETNRTAHSKLFVEQASMQKTTRFKRTTHLNHPILQEEYAGAQNVFAKP